MLYFVYRILDKSIVAFFLSVSAQANSVDSRKPIAFVCVCDHRKKRPLEPNIPPTRMATKRVLLLILAAAAGLRISIDFGIGLVGGRTHIVSYRIIPLPLGGVVRWCRAVSLCGCSFLL